MKIKIINKSNNETPKYESEKSGLDLSLEQWTHIQQELQRLQRSR